MDAAPLARPPLPDVEPGLYRHYKGHVYWVMGTVVLKHEGDRRLVAYDSVKTQREGLPGLGRELADFAAWVDPTDRDAAGEAAAVPPPGDAAAAAALRAKRGSYPRSPCCRASCRRAPPRAPAPTRSWRSRSRRSRPWARGPSARPSACAARSTRSG